MCNDDGGIHQGVDLYAWETDDRGGAECWLVEPQNVLRNNGKVKKKLGKKKAQNPTKQQHSIDGANLVSPHLSFTPRWGSKQVCVCVCALVRFACRCLVTHAGREGLLPTECPSTLFTLSQPMPSLFIFPLRSPRSEGGRIGENNQSKLGQPKMKRGELPGRRL